MITYHSADNIRSSSSVVALGCFDGVHLAHKALLQEGSKIAKSAGIPLVALSFPAPPKSILSGSAVSLLSTKREKRPLMAGCGVDIFVELRFTRSLSMTSPEAFFNDMLIEKLHAKHIVCGFNYKFGRDAAGDTNTLRELCNRAGIGLTVLPPVLVDGSLVSSSNIRQALADGNIKYANSLLGYNYFLSSRVVSGQHLGRTLGFPTANQYFHRGKAVPRSGVYLSRITMRSSTYFGISNIGNRPTVDGNTLCVETNIFDLDFSLYGKNIRVEFLDFIRPEIKFDSVDALSKQVHSDIALARTRLSENR